MIPVERYAAELRCGGRWQQCDVVGVVGEPHDLQFIVIVRGVVEYVSTSTEVRRREPVAELID